MKPPTPDPKCYCSLRFCTLCQSYKGKRNVASDRHSLRGKTEKLSTPDKNRALFLLKCGYTHIKLSDGAEYSLKEISEKAATNVKQLDLNL